MPIRFLRKTLTIAAFLLCLPLVAKANAALFFEKVAVKTSSENGCYGFASDVARSMGFQNLHRNALEVAGVKNGVYVSITCVGRGQQNAIAVVMATAPTFASAQQVGHLAATKIQGITRID